MRNSKAVLLMLSLLLITQCYAETSRNRLSQGISEDKVVKVQGNVHPKVSTATNLGALDGGTQLERVTLMFRQTDAQQKDLAALLEAQQDPTSASYHKWLSPEGYADRFGLSSSDFAKIKSWLISKGLQVVDVAKTRTWIAVNGNAAQVSAAFQTQIHRYRSDGTTFFANRTDPVIPAALSGVVGEIRGLNNIKPRPRARITRKFVDPRFTSSISGNHFLAPDDVATIYDLQSLYNNGLDGTGRKLVVVGQTNILLSDVRAFRTASGLTANDPQVVLVPGTTDPGIVTGDIDEASLDVQWSGATARKATIIYVYSGNGVFDALIYAVDNNLAPVISISYGACEAAFSASDIATLSALGQQANAQGQTIVAASGDSGAADCDAATVASASKGLAVDVPAALPFVTGIGGTRFDDSNGTFWNSTNNSLSGSAISYIPEIVWNDTAADGSLSATGGGKSVRFAKPSWQQGTGVPNDSARDMPDISFAASPDHIGYLYCVQGSCVNGYRAADNSLSVVGGTSVGAPLFSGMVAIINQKTNATQGNVNPTLYALAASSPSIFHDITSGDNRVPCTTGTTDCTTGSIGFSAGTGYDQATGLGTVDVGALLASWPSSNTAVEDFTVSSSSTALSISRGGSSTAVLTVAPVNGFSGTVLFTCTVSSGLTSTTCSIAPTSLTGAGTVMLTVSNTSATSKNLPGGFLFSFVGGVAAICFTATNTQRSRAINIRTVTTLLVLGASLLLVNCGGGSSSSNSTSSTSNTVALSGTVTVTATSGSISHSVPITVTVN